MTDYLEVFLTGISTGMGVILAKELWDFVKKYRLHRIPLTMAEEIAGDIKDKGVRRR
jgi:hypothetical protein